MRNTWFYIMIVYLFFKEELKETELNQLRR